MIVEIVISGVIIISAVYFLVISIKNKVSGDCGCGHCAEKTANKL